MSTDLLTYGSVAFALLGLVAAWLTGRARTRVTGVLVQLVNCALLVPYNLATAQYGFVVSVVLCGGLHLRALRHVRREAAALDAVG